MEFADYGLYAQDADHHIDLRNPHFRQEAYLQQMYRHPQPHPDFYAMRGYPLANLTVDVKPRLTKEQHDILESHYVVQNKPNTQTKKGFAETLGVSLDKVNNWFQNRRAKSKQDAKKAANQYTTDAPPKQPSAASSQTNLANDDISAQFINTDCLTSPMPDSAIGVDPLSLTNALGITRADSLSDTLAPHDLIKDSRHTDDDDDDMDFNRRTMTQEQFDSYNSSDFSGKVDSARHQSPKHESNDSFDSFLGGLGAPLHTDTFTHAPLFPETETQQNASPRASISGWSEASTPSLSSHPIDSGYAASEDTSPRTKSFPPSAPQWQPGTSVPCDFEAMEREFKEVAARNNTQSLSGQVLRRTSSINFADQQFSFANEQPFTRAEAPESLTQSMNDMGLSSNKGVGRGHSVSSSISGGSIAARRQRNRPPPLSGTSMRSASFCGPLPTVPTVTVSQTAPTLRRIKSSNVMNGGIANGRIQKNASSAQRSPLNMTFADAMSAQKFVRRVPSFSPVNGGLGGGLAPPAPLSPDELTHRLELQRQTSQMFGARQLSRHPSINELHEESHRQMMVGTNSFASPPATPSYNTQFARNRVATGSVSDHTPPQSAPATQQSFSNNIYSAPMSASFSQGSMIAPQNAAYAPVMQPMQNVVMPSTAQYYEMLQQQQQMNNMHLMSGAQSMPMNMGSLQYGMAPQAMYANNNNMYSFPAVQQQQQQQHVIRHRPSMSADSELFVHEYSPPTAKRLASPRKPGEPAPKNYTFTNHGPEFFEKTKKDLSNSPDSSSGASSA